MCACVSLGRVRGSCHRCCAGPPPAQLLRRAKFLQSSLKASLTMPSASCGPLPPLLPSPAREGDVRRTPTRRSRSRSADRPVETKRPLSVGGLFGARSERPPVGGLSRSWMSSGFSLRIDHHRAGVCPRFEVRVEEGPVTVG